MVSGKTIRVYLADGSVSGIKHGEIDNWTGQAIACPRSLFSELEDWPQLRKPGVYFLFGVDEESGRDAMYVGEAEVVIDRLASHATNKDFWSEFIAFTSKDENLTKGHVRYLESRVLNMADSVKRYRLMNAVSTSLPALPRPDRDAMEVFLSHMRTLLGVLGHRALEPLAQRPVVSDAAPTAEGLPKLMPPPSLHGGQYRLQTKAATAVAIRTNEGIVVLVGSSMASAVSQALSNGYRELREKLISSGVVHHLDGKLVFARDHLFSSPSQAAAVVVGYPINGRVAWISDTGKNWAQVEEVEANRLLEQLHSVSVPSA